MDFPTVRFSLLLPTQNHSGENRKKSASRKGQLSPESRPVHTVPCTVKLGLDCTSLES